MDCFLVLRGIKTLPIRMDRHSQNAARVADYLATHPKVAQVIYSFQPSHPQVELARRQMRSGGGMVSFTLKGGASEAVRVAESTALFALAESLGGMESLIEVPAAMTHASTANSPISIDPGLVRLSVGLENADDLLADLSQALG
jgi:cystathionine gamma-synthase